MTLRVSNSAFLEVLDPIPREGIGWYCRVLSEVDYATVIAEIVRFDELSWQKDKSGFGGGSITMDLDDPVWTAPLPAGQVTPLLDQEAIWQIYEDGILRGEFFAEEVQEARVVDGVRKVTLGGRGTGSCIGWAIVEPYRYEYAPGLFTPYETEIECVDVSYMSQFITFFYEAQARSTLPFVSLTFDAELDSRGNPWIDLGDFSVTAGQNLYDLLNDWCEQIGATWRMLPGFRLWVELTNGNNRVDEIVFHIGGHQLGSDRKRDRREISNNIFVYSERKDGPHLSIISDGASVTKWRKREQWIEANGAGATGRNLIGTSTLEIFKNERTGREVKVPYNTPGRRIFVDYDVMDWVTIEADIGDTSPTEMQVLTATIKVTKEGTDLELTFGTRFDSALVNQQKAIDKIGSGSSNKVQTASPGKFVSSRSGVKSSALGDLSNVDATTVVQGDTIVYNSITQTFEAAPLPPPATVSPEPPASPAVGALWVDSDASITIDQPQGSLWVPHGTPIWSEEFDGSVLNPLWTIVHPTGASAYATFTKGSSCMSIEHSSNADPGSVFHSMLFPIGPAWQIGDAIVSAWRFFGSYASNYTMTGPVLADGTVFGTNNLVQAQMYTQSDVAGPGHFRANAQPGMGGDTSGGSNTAINPTNGVIWTRLVMTAANTWRADGSPDGISWWRSPSPLSYTMTPTHMGFAISNWGTGMQSAVSLECLRRYSGVT